MSLNRKFKGVWIPSNLWLDRALTITEKVMLVEIESLDDEERGCYASNAHFAEFFALSKSRVSEVISSIERKGLISVELFRNGKQVVSRSIRIITPFDKPNTSSENAELPLRHIEYPSSENAKGSNTQSSNTVSSKSRGASPEAPVQPAACSLSGSGSDSGTGSIFDAASVATSVSSSSQASLSGKDDMVGKPPKKAGKAKATKGPAVDVGMLSLPSWLEPERLQAFVDNRRDLKKPMTIRAVELLIKELEALRLAGHDPHLALDTSILKGWTSVYAPSTNSSRPSTHKFNPRDFANSGNRSPSHVTDDDFIDGHAVRVD